MIDHCPYSCVKELWVLLVHLPDHRSEWTVAGLFWNKPLTTLCEESSDQKRPSVSQTRTKDPLGVSGWVSVPVASLHQTGQMK